MSKYEVVTIDSSYNVYIVNANSKNDAIEKVITRLYCGDSMNTIEHSDNGYIDATLIES